MASLDDIIGKAQPRSVNLRLCLRGDLVAELARLERELSDARQYDDFHNEPDRAHAVAEMVQTVEADIRENETEFVFQAVGKRAWSDLLAKHPPSEEDKKAGLDHDPESFPIVAVSASLTEPSDVTEEGVRRLSDVLTVGQWMRLWTACLSANMGDRAPGESVAASAVLQRSRQNSTTADPEGSPAASS